MTTRSQRSALGSVGFWTALVVLVANDHWLKGATVLPAWLTGKLSDFAGLFVAPVLVATLARARTPAAKLLCFALATVPFTAIKLAPGAARALEQLTHSVGLDWRIWSDPSDLLALAVLPLAWWALPGEPAPQPAPPPRWLLERVGAIAATLACLATSSGYRKLVTSIALVNVTRESVSLQVFRPSEALDCAAVVADPEASLTAKNFAFEACQELEPLDTLALDLDWSGDDNGEEHTPPPNSARKCDAVLLRAKGLTDTVLFWNDVPKAEIIEVTTLPRDDAHLVYLEQVGNKLVAARPDVAQAWSAAFELPRADCKAGSP